MNEERRFYSQTVTLLGTVDSAQPESGTFCLRCRSGTLVAVQVDKETAFGALRNIDGVDRDRVPEPTDSREGEVARRIAKYAEPGRMLAVKAIYVEHEGELRHEARTVTTLHNRAGNFLFEETHWWLTQISRFADEWLDDLFHDKRTYEWDDFAALYRTNLNIFGQPTDDLVQECATLSRLIYGLSSAYLLTGSERYLLAARAGVRYQRETFRSLSHDGQHCFWLFGKRKRAGGAVMVVPSENADDRDTIPLYEQIYALAGLCQYFRITQDREVLQDVRRTLQAFRFFFHDLAPNYASISSEPYKTNSGGYFSHIDYATLRADSPRLINDRVDNHLRKNWNSIGDHIPAYLVNLILALEPLPVRGDDLVDVLSLAKEMLWETSGLISEKFFDNKSPFVNERFHADWAVDHTWYWQQNRAIVGHNFKIVWNLTRVANYLDGEAARLELADAGSQAAWKGAEALRERAGRLRKQCKTLLRSVTELGIDHYRGGCYDAVERQVASGQPVKFVWGNTKDFWQQEQAILAYLIMAGAATGDEREEYQQLARETMAFWNLYFLDLENRGVFFRVNESGDPVLREQYAQKASHSVAGYHSFELNYLAHLYIRTFLSAKESDLSMFMVQKPDSGPLQYAQPAEIARVSEPEADRRNFCLFFRVEPSCPCPSVNVLPDFLPPGAVRIGSITVNGVKRSGFDPESFQIPLQPNELGTSIVVEFEPTGS